MSCAGVSKLSVYQSAKKRLKQQGTAGVQLHTISDLLKWAWNHPLPESIDDVEPYVTYAVPMDHERYRETDCVVLTMHTQIDWIRQLALELAGKFTWHTDGKHKLHHGKWVLVTCGPHVVALSDKNSRIVHQYRPICYMFAKQIETAESIAVLYEACDLISLRYFGVKLRPAIGCADHGGGVRVAHEAHYAGVPLAGCWPHVAWGLSHGQLLKKSHPLFDDVNTQFHLLHKAHTEGMWNVLLAALGREWGDDDRELNSLWHGRLCSPNDNWYEGFHARGGSTPSQQAQESWHLHGVMARLQGELRASTEHVFEVSLVKVMKLDASLMANKLNLELPREWIAGETFQRALIIVKAQGTMVRCVPAYEGGPLIYYVLSQSPDNKYKRLDDHIVKKYASLRRGEVSRKSFKALCDVMNSMYMVHHVHLDKCVKCEANPFHLACSVCHEYAHDGICHHVLAITHIILSKKPVAQRVHLCDLEYLCSSIGKRHQKSDGPKGAMPKALERDDGENKGKKRRRHYKRTPLKLGLLNPNSSEEEDAVEALALQFGSP